MYLSVFRLGHGYFCSHLHKQRIIIVFAARVLSIPQIRPQLPTVSGKPAGEHWRLKSVNRTRKRSLRACSLGGRHLGPGGKFFEAI